MSYVVLIDLAVVFGIAILMIWSSDAVTKYFALGTILLIIALPYVGLSNSCKFTEALSIGSLGCAPHLFMVAYAAILAGLANIVRKATRIKSGKDESEN